MSKLEQEVMSVYTTLADLLASISRKFGDEQGTIRTEEMLNYYRGIKVLCLDEIDKVKLTDWKKETIFRLLDERFNIKSKVLTVLATNFSPQYFPMELGYLESRVNGGDVIEVPGPDVRPAKRVLEKKFVMDR